MKEWRASLKKTLASATIAQHTKQAKSVFNWAVESKWLTESPLTGVSQGSFVNRKNDRIITMDEYAKLLDACPCQDWRAILALARIGGIRCPSELIALRWSDVTEKQFYVRSSKTEHHEGKEGRTVPLFNELRVELEALQRDTEFVINRYRDPKQNLGTTLAKIVKRAGLPKIKRPFDNMRTSRSNEIYREFGAHCESEWIGHSARKCPQ